jgi:hypothetical protein
MTKLLVAVVCMATLGLAQPALAAVGPECGFWEYQDVAQADFERTVAAYPTLADMYRESMDPDLNGIACEELPLLPDSLQGSLPVIGSFELNDDTMPILRGTGYSSRYFASLAGVSFDPSGSACSELLRPESLNQAVNRSGTEASRYYFLPATDSPLPPDMNDGQHAVEVLAWTTAGDPQSPVQVNEWLLSRGLGAFDAQSAPADVSQTFAAAEESAKSQGLGIWGACTVPVSLKDSGPSVAGAYDHVFRESGDGSRVVEFTIPETGLYTLTLDVIDSGPVFVAIDAYAMDGSQVYDLSLSTADPGTFSTAAQLQAGSYYFDIDAVGSWRVTLDRMDS